MVETITEDAANPDKKAKQKAFEEATEKVASDLPSISNTPQTVQANRQPCSHFLETSLSKFRSYLTSQIPSAFSSSWISDGR